MNRTVISNLSRRTVLKGLGSAGGLVLAIRVLPLLAQEAPAYGAAAMPHGTVSDPRVFVSIDPDGTVTIAAHRSEMGQGVRTGLPMIVADELEADWSRVRVVQAPGDEPRYGNQDTDGSRSTRHFMQPMRETGAAARMMLEAAAAARWGVDVAEVEAANHVVTHKPSGRKLGYGELATEAAALEVPAVGDIRLKDPAQFRYIGKEMPIVDNFDITTGRAMYGIDIRLDGMRFAVVARPPVYGGRVASYDAAAALRVPGVEKVVEIESDTKPPPKFRPLGGIAVIARNTWTAIQGRDALVITWEDGPNGKYDSSAFKAELEASARRPGVVVRAEGDVDAAFRDAARTVEAEYYVPHLAQAPMEPPAATARIVDGKCEVWACTQAAQLTRVEVADRLGLPVESVTVHVTLLGGGFGRKSKPDFAVEAAVLSQAMNGAPVKVTWTREDDLGHGYYHAVSVERLEAALDPAGKPTAWRHRTVAPTIASTFVPDPKHQAPFELGMGFVDLPFAIPNIRLENGEAAAHTRIGWFRSVANVYHAFAVQSFAAELAAAAGKDQKDYLLELIGPPRIVDLSGVESMWNYGESLEVYPIDAGRLRRVTEIAAEKAGWGRELPARSGLGIAAHRSFVTYVATVVEAAVGEDGLVSIPRVDVAVDCGTWVNPDRIRAQIEGACVFAQSYALKSAITFKDGKVEQGNFDGYDVARIDEAPREIHIHFASENFAHPPGGIGEPGVPPFAPALMNAIFAATGKRIRQLPLADQLAG